MRQPAGSFLTIGAGLLVAWGTAAATAATAADDIVVSATDVVTTTVTSTVSFGSVPTSCDARYCDSDGTMYCFYWAGLSSFDVSQHRPVPGETRTGYALCGPATTTSTITATQTTTATRAEARSTPPGSTSTSTENVLDTSTSTSTENVLDTSTSTSTISGFAKTVASERQDWSL